MNHKAKEKLTTLTVPEVAEALQLHPQTVSRWLREGKLPGRKLGGEWRVSKQALERYLEGDNQQTR